MAWYYVKEGGTATGDGGRYASEKSANSWATEFTATSEYYDNLDVAFLATTIPADGDFVMVSHLHDKFYGTSHGESIVWRGPTDTPGVLCYLLSVDDNDVTALKAGAHETNDEASSSFDNFILDGSVFHWGVDFTLNGEYLSNGTEQLLLSGMSLKFTGALDGQLQMQSTALVREVSIELGDADHTISRISGIAMHGLTVPAASVAPVPELFDPVVGGRREHIGIDISNESTTQDFTGTPGQTARSLYSGILLPSSWVGDFITDSQSTSSADSMELFNNYGDGDDDWSFYLQLGMGQIEATNSVYNDLSQTLPDQVTRISFKIDTEAPCTQAFPLIWQLPDMRLDFNNSNENTITFKIGYTGTGLTDIDLALFVVYSDITNPNLMKFQATFPIMSGSQAILNPRASPTTLTDTGVELSEWTGLNSGDDTYDLSITLTAANVHAKPAINPIVYLWLTKDLGAESLYISPTIIRS